MKKYMSILLCLVMVLSLFAGCGKQGEETTTTEHKHTYNTEWSFDESNHWYQATCEHNTLQANLGEHIDDDLDGVCDICHYAYTGCSHTYSAEWTADETGHWHAATCAHIGSVSEQGDHADSDNDGACDVCGYTGGHEHTFMGGWTTNDTQHWHDSTCGHDVVDSLEDHLDITNDGICDTCGLDYSGCVHTYSDEWRSDVTFHWHSATCEHIGAVIDMEQHVDLDENGHCDVCDYLMCDHADFDLDGECDICGWTDPDHVHEYGDEIGSNVTSHWFVSTCHPGATSAPEDHVDEDNDGSCDICLFQMCGHSYSETWSNDETHHWKAILCSCSIARKDYAEHVDNDGDGGCDICMYGVPIEACYEVIVDDQPFTLVEGSGMIFYAPVVINFPQPGRYVITPSNLDIRVWLTNDNSFNNTGSSLTLEVEEAGEMTLYFRYFDFSPQEGKEVNFTYSVTRMDDLVITTMQGKVELPANTRYTLVFQAPQSGTYKLITGVDGIVIGITEDTMEYFRGHIEFTVEEGDIINFYIEYNDETVKSFIFDWRLEEPFVLPVGEGNYSVDVAPNRIDYKIEFTAPEAGYYRLSVTSEWLTFCAMGDVYNEPVRLETTQVLTPYLEAGEVYTTWLQTVYNYPAATNVYDTLSIVNVGEVLWVGNNSVRPGSEGSRYSIQAPESAYYRIEITGGELGIIAPTGEVTWITDAYEVNLSAGDTYIFMIRGSGSVDWKISKQLYLVDLVNGNNCVTLAPNRYYIVNFMYRVEDTGELEQMSPNSTVALSWDGNLQVFVNGETYQQGASLDLLNNTVTILIKSNGEAEVNIKVTLLNDANDREVEGASEAELVLNQSAILAVNRDGDGAKATFTADSAGTYTLTTYDAKAVIYVVSADGSSKQKVLSGAGSFDFELEAGQTIEFYVQTVDESADSITLVVTPGA